MEINIKIEKSEDGILSISLPDDIKPNFTLVGLKPSGIKIEDTRLEIGLGSVNPNQCGSSIVSSGDGENIVVGKNDIVVSAKLRSNGHHIVGSNNSVIGSNNTVVNTVVGSNNTVVNTISWWERYKNRR